MPEDFLETPGGMEVIKPNCRDASKKKRKHTFYRDRKCVSHKTIGGKGVVGKLAERTNRGIPK